MKKDSKILKSLFFNQLSKDTDPEANIFAILCLNYFSRIFPQEGLSVFLPLISSLKIKFAYNKKKYNEELLTCSDLLSQINVNFHNHSTLKSQKIDTKKSYKENSNMAKSVFIKENNQTKSNDHSSPFLSQCSLDFNNLENNNCFQSYKQEKFVSFKIYKRRKVLNDVIISSFGFFLFLFVHFQSKNDLTQILELLQEWSGGLPLKNESSLNYQQIEFFMQIILKLSKLVILIH